MPNTIPAPRVPHRRNRHAVRSTSLRALAVAAHLERSGTAPVRHGPEPDGDTIADTEDRTAH